MDKNKILKKLLLNEDPALAQVYQQTELSDLVQQLIDETKTAKNLTINGASLKGDKGEKGETGEKGDRGEKGDKGDKGETGNDGLNGKNGRNGLDGLDGLNGLNGKDGSPDSPQDVADKLNTLKQAVDIEVIKGVPTIDDFFSALKDPKGKYRLSKNDIVGLPNIDQRWHGGGTTSPLTTKGDLWGYNTSNARIPVGTNGQVLTVDLTTALGVKWGTATGGAPAGSSGEIQFNNSGAFGASSSLKWDNTNKNLLLTNSNLYNNGGINNLNSLNDVLNVNKTLSANVSGSWSTGATGGTGRAEFSSVLFNSKMYSWGGTDFSSNILNSLDIYDLPSDTWSTGLAGGTARLQHTSILYNGKMYSWAGKNSSFTAINSLDIYNVASNSWSTGASGGTARGAHSSIVYNGKIYSWGGFASNIFAPFNSLDIYDIASNTWSTGASGGTARYWHTSVVRNGKIYHFGGVNAAGSVINTVDIYNIATNTWSTGTAGGTGRYGHTSVVYNGKVYSWGGTPGSLTSVDIYDIATDSWSTGVSGGTSRYNFGSVLSNGKIYSWGGFNGGNTVDIYDIGYRQNIFSIQQNGQDLFNFRTENELFLNNGELKITGGNLTLTKGDFVVSSGLMSLNADSVRSNTNLRIQSTAGQLPLVFTGTGISVGSGTDNDNGVFMGMGYNSNSGNKQLWVGDSSQIGDGSKYVFRMITGFPIPMIDAVTADGTSRGNINLGYTDNNVGIGWDVVSYNNSDILAKLDIIGNGNGGSGVIYIRDSNHTILSTFTDDGRINFNAVKNFSSPNNSGDLFVTDIATAIANNYNVTCIT